MPTDEPQPPSERPILAFFDVDNTLLRGASIYHVARGAWRRRIVTLRDIARFAWHQARFVAVGETRANLAMVRDRALELAAGYSVADLTQLANDIYEREIAPRLWPETVALTREHLRLGHEVWLITATPQVVAQVIADRLGLTGALGTVIEAVDGVLTGRLIGDVLHGELKAVAAAELARSTGANLAECWAYSDSRNDVPLLSLVGNRVVVNPDAELASHAKKHGWAVLTLRPASIREAQRRVRHQATAARRDNKKR